MWKLIVHAKYSLFILYVVVYGCTSKLVVPQNFQQSELLNLPVAEIRNDYIPYKEFCLTNPGECDLTGQSTIVIAPETWKQINTINNNVNRDVYLSFDKDQYQKEEYWTYPNNGFGDCEDIALEKRARLVRIGYPRGALRIAIVHHKQTLISHAILTVETTQGTYVMDSTTGAVYIWYQTPYNFESRERTDGKWERYDQDMWTYD